MAARALCLMALLSLGSGQQAGSSVNYVVDIDVASCSTTQLEGAFQYFDSVTMACKKCSQNSTIQRTTTDGLSCECQAGHKYVNKFGGDQVTCAACAANEKVSTDGWECKVCADGSNSDTCTCQAANTITAERAVNGLWINRGPPQKDQCVLCQGNTVPNAKKDRCIRCSDDLNLGFTTCPVPCPENQQADGFCFPNADDLLPATTILYEIPSIEGTDSTQSLYFETHLRAAYAMCTNANYQNATACQVVANLCALTLYNQRQGRICNFILNASPLGVPFPLLYYSEDADDVIGATDIPDSYTFNPPVTIPFEAAVHTLDGRYLGNVPLTDGLLQLCDTTETIANAAYVFGTYYSYSCSIKAKGLWDTVKHPLRFYDIYLKYQDRGQARLYKVPLQILDVRNEGDNLVNNGELKDWRITRRMFLVDNQMTITAATGSAESTESVQEAQYVRYAKDITLHITLQTDTSDGRIEIPYFTIKYGEVSLQQANEGASVEISFKTTYTMSWGSYRRNFQIAVGTLGSLAALYAGFRSWVWSKRAGRLSIDFASLVNFIFFMAGSLSNIFFIITFCIAFYWFIFFKRQDVVYLVHPDGIVVEEWEGLLIGAFALRCLSVLHVMVMQCSADIFLVDWERPRGIRKGQDGKKMAEVPVSIWRTYFVANEWNEIQTIRKINANLQVVGVVFFLLVVGFEQTTTLDPNGKVDKDAGSYVADQSYIYRYALGVLVYVLFGVVQWVFFTFIYERFVEDQIQQFVDLCSMSNVSVFVMANANFGYYIHGRSVHGKADTDLREMSEMMKREEEDLCGKRGLVPDTEEQTFIMSLPKRLRVKYEQVYLPAALELAGAMSHMESGAGGGRSSSSAKEKSVEAYNMLNKFLCTFIDHGLRDVDYVVKDKTLLESIMDTEFFDTTDKGIFYKDNGHSFDQVLFYGNEMTLLIFDTLLFSVVDMIWKNYLLDGIIVFLVSNLLRMIRDTAGRKNLARKTLVDERFLI